MSKQKRTEDALFQRYLISGKKNVAKNQFSNALKKFSKAIKLNPKFAEAYFERGMVYEVLKKQKNALEDYDKAIEFDPSFFHAYVHRALLYAELGKYDKALKDLEKVYKADPRPHSRASCLFNEGSIYEHLGKHKQALECYDKALKLKPSKFMQERIYVDRGVIYGRLEQYEKSLKDFNRAIELNPKHAMGYGARGVTYTRLEKFDKALKDFEKTTKLEPTSVIGHLNKGLVYRITKQFERALEAFRCVIELQPKNTDAHFQLGLIYEERRQFDKALEEYDRILALIPKFAHVYTHKGIVYGNLCAYEEAIQNLSKAIELDSQETVAYFNRGIGYKDIGNYELALRDFETTIKLDPSLDFVYLEKGKVLCYMAEEGISFKKRKKLEQKIINSFKKVLQITKDPELKKLTQWWIRFFKKYCDASIENKKRLKVFAEVYGDTLEANIFSTLRDEQSRLSKFMSLTKTFPKSECFFQVLRRWNSFTPVIPGKSRSNLGGGYFFACDGQGIIIDPGYNFVENFIKNGLSLGDIDVIVLTHAHDDHTADFEAILSLFSKLEDNKKIDLFANLGASNKFSHLVSKNESIFGRVAILNENQTYQVTPNLKMKAVKALHKDILTRTSAKGLIFDSKRGSQTYRLGITGDTRFYTSTANENGLYSHFGNVDVLILHIGSIHRSEFEFLEDNFETHKYDGEHLGIRGIVNLIFECRPKLATISEFGEELRELRSKISYKIDNSLENYDSTGNVRVIPGDIGLKVIFDDSVKVKCEICGTLVKLKDIKYSETLINHKIAYHCKHHKRAEIVEKFKEKEERELRVRAESMGCTIDLISPIHYSPRFVEEESA